jgi:hypothetical protein
MTRRISIVLLAGPCLLGCTGEGAPGSFEKFTRFEMCAASTDGGRFSFEGFKRFWFEDHKRFWLKGYMLLPISFSVEGGRTTLDFYAQIDGDGRGVGRPVSITVFSPGDIDDLRASMTDSVKFGRRSPRQGKIDPDALRIRALNGTATPRDKIKLTFDVVANDGYWSCKYRFVKAEIIYEII